MWAIALIILRRRLAEGGLGLTPPNDVDPDALLPGGLIQAAGVQVPAWLSFAFSFGLFLLLVLILWNIWYRRRPITNPLDMVAQEAQLALDELEAGGNFRNVILRCYYDMVRALSFQRSIRRRDAMTAREFEQRLVELGLPGEPVGRLTRLFELVRYGAKEPGEQAERQAVDCLDAIVKASGEIS